MDYEDLKERMGKTINNFAEKLAEVRAGRANPAILNKVKIDYYGTPTPINQVAGIDIGINPNNDGKVIRLAFPELNEERRKELVKDIKKMAEEAKVAIRAIRRDGIEEAKSEQKEGNMTEDELKNAENEIQKLTDKHVEEIDEILSRKEKEIMSV